jgi:hypothetical protein
VNTTAAVSPRASSSTKAKTKIDSSLECYIGKQVAGAAACLLVGLTEYADGGLTGSTKLRAGEWIAEIYKLWRIGIPDFYGVARRAGVAALLESCDSLTPSTAKIAVDEVLAIHEKTVKSVLS